MPDSTHQFFIEKGEKPVISIDESMYATKEADEDTEAGNNFDARNANIGIELPDLHLSLSLPEDVLRELLEKAQEFLAEKKSETQERIESEPFPAG